MSDHQATLTLASEHELEVEIKRSRFRARAAPVGSEEEADRLRQTWSVLDATHNCWAWRIGDRVRFSDDGEPGGTAGRPILGAIEGQGLSDVLVVVTRWFGGTKLGAGGLVRAYGGTAASCLRQAPKRRVWPMLVLRVELPFEHVNALYPLLERYEAIKETEEFTNAGFLGGIRIQARRRADFEQSLADATRGSARIDPEDP